MMIGNCTCCLWSCDIESIMKDLQVHDRNTCSSFTSNICIRGQQEISSGEAKQTPDAERKTQVHPNLEEAEEEERRAGFNDCSDAGVGAHSPKEHLQSGAPQLRSLSAHQHLLS